MMKLNIFLVPPANRAAMLSKFDLVGLKEHHNESNGEWNATFYFSNAGESVDIPWIKTYSHIFAGAKYQNAIYYGAYVFEKDETIYVLSYGKSHFYIRLYADSEFGIEVAKRIANNDEIRQTSCKRYGGKESKKIRNFKGKMPLNIESGETLDYLQAPIADEFHKQFGKSAKFGASLLITPDILPEQIGGLLDNIEAVRKMEERFKIPRTVLVTDSDEVAKYDGLLVSALLNKADINQTHLSVDGYEIIGVDFIFSGSSETYRIYSGSKNTERIDTLSLEKLQSFIAENRITYADILKIKIERQREGERRWPVPLKAALEFTIEEENVLLSQGNWFRFNEDYIDQLNDYVDSIALEVVEGCFSEIADTEPEFIKRADIEGFGYNATHKDFDKIKLKSDPNAKIEAWDLIKGKTVYAVKFGTAQKLGYVCDQAMTVLEIIRNKANVKRLEDDVESYCLWLAYEAKKLPSPVSSSNSIILKQKIELWARKCYEVGLTPRLKISRKITNKLNNTSEK